MDIDDDWYAHGEFVLDQMLGLQRAETVSVYAPAVPPTPEAVRMTLNVPRPLTIEISTIKPRSVCTLDDIVMAPSGELWNLRTNSVHLGDTPVLDVSVYDLGADDILRLYRIHLDFPEVEIRPELITYLEASFAYLQSLRERFEELELLFLKHAPFTRWRAKSASAWAPRQKHTSSTEISDLGRRERNRYGN